MKKAYYVNSIFEKMSFAAGIKSFAVLLVFSLCFLGISSDASAQTLSLNAPNLDQSFLKEFEVNKDTDHARTVIREQQKILHDYQPADGLDEANHAARMYFLNDLGHNINTQPSVMGAITLSHANLHQFVGRYVVSIRQLVDVEDIVSDYVELLQ